MNELRKLPSVEVLRQSETLKHLLVEHGSDLVTQAARQVLADLRQHILQTGDSAPALSEIEQAIVAKVLQRVKPTLQPVINASGVIIHTNLGRALLSQRAQAAMVAVADAYNNLEYSLDRGSRASRYRHAEALLCQLSGAEAAVVVNNNAAALVLCLSQLAQGQPVLISRSQLIEIGGGFRIPDIMAQSGAKLVEVGSTNRTYIRDYEAHLGPANDLSVAAETRLILRVHSSNFKILGFTAEPSLAELVELGNRHNIPVMDDLGSGTLLDTAEYGLAHEPTIQESIAAGASIVTASGDKLLGGPQAGLIMGKAKIIQQLKKHPLIRALRVDKITLAALQATLLAYLEHKATSEIPVWQMIAADTTQLNHRAQKWLRTLTDYKNIEVMVVDTYSTVGGGSLPGQQLATKALAIKLSSPNRFVACLHAATPPVIARVEDKRVILDPRTVLPQQDNELIQTLTTLLQRG